MTSSNQPTLADDAERLAAVRRYNILDTPPDGAFDRVTRLAAGYFSVPICIVSIVDHDRIWFKSHHGVEVSEVPRSPGLCASAILDGAVAEVVGIWGGVVSGVLNPADSGVGAPDWRPRHDEEYHDGSSW